MRIGIGYDIHKLQNGDFITLGGIKIPCDKSLIAHSDGDVLIHAIIDAILGALAKRDIGYHFPDTDEKYKNADSIELLKNICNKYRFKIINIDSNIIAQKPKLMPYIEDMRKNIAKALFTDIENVSIKAKTKEGLDAVGNMQAIEANCVVLLEN
ncbi:MAG: 2-C-methyl-D-erythritol 2,4-cyclodiphosphate synthase [Cyanobacteria bacterium SIG30]|nr:2-C-methyl-D-erythritol 2,4-cyclodiphosphate synthase [Cyanobacteria bacterium SIG30]